MKLIDTIKGDYFGIGIYKHPARENSYTIKVLIEEDGDWFEFPGGWFDPYWLDDFKEIIEKAIKYRNQNGKSKPGDLH